MSRIFRTAGPSTIDEQRREDAEHHRDQHLDRRLLRPLLGQLTALDAHLVGLGAQHAADRHAERVGLEDGEHERADLGDVGPGLQGSHGVGPRRAGSHLAEHAAELVGQRARHRGDRAVERLLEAEAGLDADREQVEDVGQLVAQLVLALLDPAVEHGVGAEDADQREQAGLRRVRDARRGPGDQDEARR